MRACLAAPVLFGLAAVALAACPDASRSAAPMAPGEPRAMVAGASQVEVFFRVEWPRGTQTIPTETRAVVFYVFRGTAYLAKAAAQREAGAASTTASVRLFPGAYTVKARAYATATPADDSPVLASATTDFTLIEGTEPGVELDLVPAASPVPEPPIETSPSTTPIPTPSAGSGSQTPGGGIDLTVK